MKPVPDEALSMLVKFMIVLEKQLIIHGGRSESGIGSMATSQCLLVPINVHTALHASFK